MITAFLTTLVLLDCALILLILKYFRKKELKNDLLAEITEERSLLTGLHDTVRTALLEADANSKRQIAKISQLAAEIEQEIKNSGKTIAESIEGTVSSIGEKFREPMHEMQSRKNALEILFKKADNQKVILQKLLDRTDIICKFLGESMPYEELLRELEAKKFADARHLIATGLTTDQVAKTLGLNSQEINLLSSVITTP